MKAFARFIIAENPSHNSYNSEPVISANSAKEFRPCKIQNHHPTVADFRAMVAAGGWQDDTEERAAIQEYDGGLTVGEKGNRQ